MMSSNGLIGFGFQQVEGTDSNGVATFRILGPPGLGNKIEIVNKRANH